MENYKYSEIFYFLAFQPKRRYNNFAENAGSAKNKMDGRKYKEKLEIVKKLHVKQDGTMRSIVPLEKKHGTYYYTKTAAGQQFTAKTYPDMIEKLYSYYDGDSLYRDCSIGHIWQQHLTEYKANNPTKGKTIGNMEAEYNRFVSPDFALRDVRHITAQEIEVYCLKLIQEKHLKKKAFLNFKSLLNNIFATAMYQGIISYNPAKSIRNQKLIEYCDQSLACRASKDVLLSDTEKEKVFAEISRRKNLARNQGYYYFEGMTRLHNEIGCRPGELCALKWQDINKESAVLHIHSQIIESGMNRKYAYVPLLKNEKGVARGGRYFPITANMQEIFTEMADMQEKCHVKSDYVFCHRDGSMIVPKAYEIYLNKIFKALGIEHKTSYVFRRGINQQLDNHGISPADRAKLLGHTVQTNLSCYTFGNDNVVELGRKALESQ